MPTISGFTTFGIIRKRMSDLFSDFAARIKENGVFGTQTTADLPDQFATDPLVQIMATTSASLHEVWEAVELYYAQLDPRSADGIYLENMHGLRLGIARGAGQTVESYRSAILSAIQRPTRNHITTIASARPDIDCAVLLTTTPDYQIPGIPTPGNVLVVKGCPSGTAETIDYDALAEDIFNSVELGVHQLYGDKTGTHAPNASSCITYQFMEAQPLFVAVEVDGYFTSSCGSSELAAQKSAIAVVLKDVYSSCGLGSTVNEFIIRNALTRLSGFVATSIRLARRAPQLWGDGCAPVGAPLVEICGKTIPWVTSKTCGIGAGEIWCAPSTDCVNVNPWEYILVDEQFITVQEDETKGGCA